jgi:hypothetical protein
MLVMRFGPGKMPVFEMLVLTVFGLLTVSAMRMLVWWALVWPWVMAPYLWALWQQWQARQASAAGEPSEPPGHAALHEQAEPAVSSPREASMRTLIAMACVFMAVLLAPPSHNLLVAKPRGAARVLRQDTPVYVAEELQRRGLEGKLFAPMDWADYLVWKTDRKLRPLVHSHVHLIADATWQDYRRIAMGDPDWESLSRAHDLDYLVLDRRRNAELIERVQEAKQRNQPDLRVIYQDERCLLVQLLKPSAPESSAG